MENERSSDYLTLETASELESFAHPQSSTRKAVWVVSVVI